MRCRWPTGCAACRDFLWLAPSRSLRLWPTKSIPVRWGSAYGRQAGGCVTRASTKSRPRGGFGVREPASQLPQPAHIDAFIIPGLGFDRHGGRLGYGRGFYDAALRKQPAALRIAVGYDFQLQAAIPTGEQDEAVDFVVTPSERYTTAAHTLPAPPNKEESP